MNHGAISDALGQIAFLTASALEKAAVSIPVSNIRYEVFGHIHSATYRDHNKSRHLHRPLESPHQNPPL